MDSIKMDNIQNKKYQQIKKNMIYNNFEIIYMGTVKINITNIKNKISKKNKLQEYIKDNPKDNMINYIKKMDNF